MPKLLLKDGTLWPDDADLYVARVSRDMEDGELPPPWKEIAERWRHDNFPTLWVTTRVTTDSLGRLILIKEVVKR